MAELAGVDRPLVIATHVPLIDLTIDDDESSYGPYGHSGLTSRPSPLRSNHGLILDSTFGNRIASISRRHTRDTLPGRNVAPNSDNPSKRRRLLNAVTADLLGENIGKGDKQQSPSNALSERLELPSTLDNEKQSGSKVHDDSAGTPSPRLAKALKYQIIPHIEKTVERYSFVGIDEKRIRITIVKQLFQQISFDELEETGELFSNTTLNKLNAKADLLVANFASDHGGVGKRRHEGINCVARPLQREGTIGKHLSLSECLGSGSTSEKGQCEYEGQKENVVAFRATTRITASQVDLDSDTRDQEGRIFEIAQPILENAVNEGTNALSNFKKLARARVAKSERQSKIMKERWARGGMASAVERKKANKRARELGVMNITYQSSNGSLNVPSLTASLSVNDRNLPGISRRPSEPGSLHKNTSVRLVPSKYLEGHHTSDDWRMTTMSIVQRESQIDTYLSPSTCYSAESISSGQIALENSQMKPTGRENPTQFPRALYVQETSPQEERLHPIIDTQNYKHPRQLPYKKSRCTTRAAVQEIACLRFAALDPELERPYLDTEARSDVARGLKLLNKVGCTDPTNVNLLNDVVMLHDAAFHVDFTNHEIDYLVHEIDEAFDTGLPLGPDPRENLKRQLVGRSKQIPKIVRVLNANSQDASILHGRSQAAISAFLRDVSQDLHSTQAHIVRLRAYPPRHDCSNPLRSITSILFDRELHGRSRKLPHIAAPRGRLLTCIEDTIVKQAEFTDCAGDIASISWLPGGIYICGTVTHSDSHNQQYNKAGNLMVGSASSRGLISIAGHQVARPIVHKGDNSLPSMRETQDPWLFTSVTSTAYSKTYGRCFTGSFDNTVKVWDVSETAMKLCGTWYHAGHVNFVVTSPQHGMIATAADVREGAVRVYRLDPQNVSDSTYVIYSGERADEQARQHNDTWAYYPATIQWGKSSSACHLLLVGYSPRSYDPHDEVPEVMANTGELCLWDMRSSSRIPITSARTQNVFEVVWHPTQPIFVAATSPSGVFEDGVKTQLRMFGQTDSGSFSHMSTFDCSAIDINEITIMPNSQTACYITASCTDSSTYVWDSAQGDQPIRILCHGTSIDDQAQGWGQDTADNDNGVKFAAWGKSADRFYTGSSDGVVKCWNVRAPGSAVFVRNVATLSGGVSVGAFSDDYSKLLVGDATGKVHLFAFDDTEPGENRNPVVRKTIVPHRSLCLPSIHYGSDVAIPRSVERTALEIAREYVERGQIVIHQDEYVGAIQGPYYASTELFASQDHKNNDPERRVRRPSRRAHIMRYHPQEIEVSRLPTVVSSKYAQHSINIKKDLSKAELSRLEAEGLEVDFDQENDFDFEIGPAGSFTDEDILDGFKLGEIKGFNSLRSKIVDECIIHKDLDLILKKLSL